MGIGTPKSSTAIKAIIKKLLDYYSRSDLLQERNRVLRFYLLGDCSTDINYRLRQPLQDQNNERGVINNFIGSKHQSLMLMLGDAGAGKSAYTQWLVNYFCQNNNDETYPGFVPIRIELKTYNENSVKNAIDYVLKNQFNFSEDDIKHLKEMSDVVFLLDGYDEISGHSKINIYKENQCLKNWPKAKVLITCRNGHFKDEAECKELFDIPAHKYAHQADTSYADLLYLAPFDEKQIERYLDQFENLSANSSLTTADIEHAKSLIKQHENLKVVVQNPFVLQIFAETFPSLLKIYGNEISKIVLSDIYKQFLDDWFTHAKKRLEESAAYNKFEEKIDNIKECFYDYAKAFAYELLAEDEVEIIYTPINPHNKFSTRKYTGHKAFEHFFKSHDTKPESQRLLDAQRAACPLRRTVNDVYSFIHKSFQDYLAASYLFELTHDRYKTIKDTKHKNTFKEILHDPANSYHQDLIEVLDAWNKRYLTEERLVLRFLSERLEKLPFEEFESLSEELLLPMIQYSAKDKSYAKSASSIISALGAARKCMSGWDLRGVSIPKADLSRSILHRTNFAYADLREVRFNQAYMAETDLSYSQMKDVQFGELPYLKFNKEVRCLSLSPDGKTLAVGQDKKIIISEITTGKQLIVLQEHKFEVTSVAISADGRIVASASRGGIACMSFDEDGTTRTSGSYDKNVRLLDAKSGEELQVLHGHNEGVTSIAISADGATVATGSDDNSVRLWDTKSGKALHVLQGHNKGVTSIAISANGTTVASGSYDNSIRLWDAKSGKALHVLQGNSWTLSVAISSDSTTVASGSKDGSVRLWDSKSGKLLEVLKGHTGEIKSVIFCVDDSIVASGGMDESVRLWDSKSGKLLEVLKGHRDYVFSIACSHGATLLSGGNDNTVRFWNVKSNMSSQSLRNYSNSIEGLAINLDTSVPFESCAISPDGTTIASGGSDNRVRLCEAKSGKMLQVLKGHDESVSCVAFSADGTTLASGSVDNSVRLWEAKSGKMLQVMEGNDGWVNSVAFSADGVTLVLGCEDGTVQLWDTKRGKLLKVLEDVSSGDVFSVGFSIDGTIVASGSMDNNIRLWDVQSGEVLWVLEGHVSWVNSVAFSANGVTLVSGSQDNTVRLWEINSGKKLDVLHGHSDSVISVAFNIDGTIVASGSYDETVRIWDMISYQCIAVIANGAPVSSVSFNKQGQLLTGDKSPNSSVRFWQLINNQWHLKWSIPQQSLCIAGCTIEDVKDLSSINRRLIEQRASEIDLFLSKNKSTSGSPEEEMPRKYSSTFEDDELSSAPTSIPLKPIAVTSEKPSSTTLTFPANMRYEYEDSDINTILEIKIKEISNTQGVMNYVLGAVDNIVPNQLQRSVQTCIDELRTKPSAQHTQYNLLIPFNLGCYHWISLLIRLDANFKATKIVYCDSLKRVTQVPEPITIAINTLWQNMQISVVELFTQSDMKSCGVLAIVNLMNIIQERNESRKLTEDEVKELRRNDLLLVKYRRPAYFDSFYQRQLANKPSIAAIPQQVAMLSQEVKFSPQEYKRIMQGYELIKDISDNNLKQILQGCLKDNVEFNDKVHLYLQQIRIGFNKILSQSISQADKQSIKKLITLFFGFEPGEAPLIDVGDIKFRLEHEELRMLGKMLNGEDIESLKEFTQAVDAQISADEDYAKKLQEEEYQRVSRQTVSTSSQVPEKTLPSNSANPISANIISPHIPPSSSTALPSYMQSTPNLKQSATIAANGELIGKNKEDYARLKGTAADIAKILELLPPEKRYEYLVLTSSLTYYSDATAQKPSGTVPITNNLLHSLQSLNVEGSVILGNKISSVGIDVVPEAKEQPVHIEAKESANKLDAVPHHVKISSDQQLSVPVSVESKSSPHHAKPKSQTEKDTPMSIPSAVVTNKLSVVSSASTISTASTPSTPSTTITLPADPYPALGLTHYPVPEILGLPILFLPSREEISNCPLLLAIAQNNLPRKKEELAKLLENNHTDSKSNNAVHYAAYFGNTTIVSALQDACFDLTEQNKNKSLENVDSPDNPDNSDPTGEKTRLTPIHLAIYANQIKWFKEYYSFYSNQDLQVLAKLQLPNFIENKIAIELNAFHFAILLGREAFVAECLARRKDKDPNKRIAINLQVEGLGNVLHLAILAEQPVVLRMLLNHISDEEGKQLLNQGTSAQLGSLNALSYAAATNHVFCLRELLNQYWRRPVYQEDRSNHTLRALFKAIKHGSLQAVKTLIGDNLDLVNKNYAVPENRDNLPIPPLFYANSLRDKETDPQRKLKFNAIKIYLTSQFMNSSQYRILDIKKARTDNLVFCGGGVKGIGLAGAYEEFVKCLRELSEEAITPELKEVHKIQPLVRVAGTSSGAIFATLVALGFEAKEIKDILWEMNFDKFMDSEFADTAPQEGTVAYRAYHKVKNIVASISNMIMHPRAYIQSWVGLEGLCKGEYFRQWFIYILSQQLTAIKKSEAQKATKTDLLNALEKIPTRSCLDVTKLTFNSPLLNDLIKLDEKRFANIKEVLRTKVKGGFELQKYWNDLEAQEQNLQQNSKSNPAIINLLKTFPHHEVVDAELLTFKDLQALVTAGPSRFRHLHIFTTKISATGQPIEITRIHSEEEIYDDYLIADAVRCSMSIPLVYQPYQLHRKLDNRRQVIEGNYYLDGGILKNYAIEAFDFLRYQPNLSEGNVNYRVPNNYTRGFHLYTPPQTEEKVKSLMERLLKALSENIGIIHIASELCEIYYSAEDLIAEFEGTRIGRTIELSNCRVDTTDFHLTEEKKLELYNKGRSAVRYAFGLTPIPLPTAFLAAPATPALSPHSLFAHKPSALQPLSSPSLIETLQKAAEEAKPTVGFMQGQAQIP